MKEYLPQLTTRKKWATEGKRPMAVEDLVWVRGKQYHPFDYLWEEMWRFTLVTMMFAEWRQ